jgi:hypothetical protein
MKDISDREHRDKKAAVQDILDKHLCAAFAEMKESVGTAATSVKVDVIESHENGSERPTGLYVGCAIEIFGKEIID